MDGELGRDLCGASLRLCLSRDLRRQIYGRQCLRLSPASLARTVSALHAAAGSSAGRDDEVATLRLEPGLPLCARVRVRRLGFAGEPETSCVASPGFRELAHAPGR